MGGVLVLVLGVVWSLGRWRMSRCISRDEDRKGSKQCADHAPALGGVAHGRFPLWLSQRPLL